jgi:hypothetical protein
MRQFLTVFAAIIGITGIATNPARAIEITSPAPAIIAREGQPIRIASIETIRGPIAEANWIHGITIIPTA